VSPSYVGTIEVWLRPGIADPQGATVKRALEALSYQGISGVRVGKVIEVALEAPDYESAGRTLQDMTDRLLANPVIEEAAVKVTGPVEVAGSQAGSRGL